MFDDQKQPKPGIDSPQLTLETVASYRNEFLFVKPLRTAYNNGTAREFLNAAKQLLQDNVFGDSVLGHMATILVIGSTHSYSPGRSDENVDSRFVNREFENCPTTEDQIELLLEKIALTRSPGEAWQIVHAAGIIWLAELT